MEDAGGEHWQAQQQWAEEARANGSPHHQARTVAQVSKHLNLGGTPTANEENQEEERNRPVTVAKGGRQGWTAIDLGGQGLRALSDVLFRYDFLQKLYLNHNNLHHLPASIGRLKSLVELDASSNQLRELPAEIGMLTNLERLMLVDNHLRTLPFELGHLCKLVALGVEGNPLNEDDMKVRIMRTGIKEFIEYLRDEMPGESLIFPCWFVSGLESSADKKLDPEPPTNRDWLALEETLNGASQPEMFTAFSYNILCDKYATRSQYGYVPARVLNWEHRKEVILGEMLAQDPDIICLQELDKYNYDEFFRPKLAESGYKGYYAQKSRHETAPTDQARHIDGCGTFYKEKKYILLDSQHLNFGRKAVERYGRNASADMINRVWQRDDIGTVVLLENRTTGSRMIVANAHFYWDPAYKDVKLIQVAVLMEELSRLGEEYIKVPACKNKKVFQFSDAEEIAEPIPEPGPSQEYSSVTQVPVIICGDFNSGKDSAVYDLLADGQLASKHEDLGDRNYGSFSEIGMSHPFTLKSAYSSIGELSFTNYTPGFTDVLDYIWYSANSLRVSGLLGDVDKEYLQRVPGFPNFHFPSDHLALVAEFVVCGNKKLKVTEADFGSGSGSGSGSQRNRK